MIKYATSRNDRDPVPCAALSNLCIAFLFTYHFSVCCSLQCHADYTTVVLPFEICGSVPAVPRVPVPYHVEPRRGTSDAADLTRRPARLNVIDQHIETFLARLFTFQSVGSAWIALPSDLWRAKSN